jgi:hypothetical protein
VKRGSVCSDVGQQGQTRGCELVWRAHDRLIHRMQVEWQRSRNNIRRSGVRDRHVRWSGNDWSFWHAIGLLSVKASRREHAICPPANLPRLEGGTISLALLYGKRPLQYTTCGNVLLR